jgi:hypothetical protein
MACGLAWTQKWDDYSSHFFFIFSILKRNNFRVYTKI